MAMCYGIKGWLSFGVIVMYVYAYICMIIYC